MQITHAVAGVAALLALAAKPADACSLEEGVHATVYPSKATEVGHRPWIRIDGMARTIALTIVDASCPADAKTPCKGTDVPYDKAKFDHVIRPKADLPSGARVQIVNNKKDIVATFTVRSTTSALPAWGGAKLTKTTFENPGFTSCMATGPVLAVEINETKAVLADAMLLLYVTKPDLEHLDKDLFDIMSLDGAKSLEYRTGDTLPTKAWLVLVDQDGHVGKPIEIAPKMSAADIKRRNEHIKKMEAED